MAGWEELVGEVFTHLGVGVEVANPCSEQATQTPGIGDVACAVGGLTLWGLTHSLWRGVKTPS